MYSSQRALSFLPELKRNKFAWDILNQSHRFPMFWKNALASDIGWLNTKFVCCFLWRNSKLVSPRSLVRRRSLKCFAHLNSTWFEIYLSRCKQTYHWSHVVVDFFWRRIFFCQGIFLPVNFLPGNFSAGEFFASSQESSSSSSVSNLGLEYYVVVPWSYDTLHSLPLTCANTYDGLTSWINYFFIASPLNQSKSLASRLWRNRDKHWKGFATQRRLPPKPFSGDVTGGADISGKFVPFEFG